MYFYFRQYRCMAYRRFVQCIWHRPGRHNRNILPSSVVQKIRETFPSEEYCGFKYATIWVTFVWNMYYFYELWIIYTADYCELYTLQIIIYNLHVELNLNVHTVFSLSGKSWSMSLNEVCFLKFSEWWCQRRWIGSVEHFYII